MNELKIRFWDVQHGNATHIRTPNGRTVVVDLGVGMENSRTFSPLLELRKAGYETIDSLVITHPHTDHIDDVENLSRFRVLSLSRPKSISIETIYGGNRESEAGKVDQYLEFSSRFTQTATGQNDLSDPSVWGGCSFQIFTPPNMTGANLNNHSKVLYVEYRNVGILIPGDNEAPSWKALLQLEAFRRILPRVYVLLAPHHGRQAGFCEDLFAQGLLSPRVTIISDKRSGETSATDLYHRNTLGWGVKYPTGLSVRRKCVSTRCDGHIDVEVYLGHDGRPYLSLATELGSGREAE